MLALVDSPARQFLLQLGDQIGRPRAILVVSAHWEESTEPAVSITQWPETIHDFRGFPQALFDMQYPAPGAPEVALDASMRLEHAGISVSRDASRGLDHGAWVPLRLMYPGADIPVTQLSLVRGGTPTLHEKIGAALASLRQDGVLVIGSGAFTHNLAEFRGQPINAETPGWVREFGEWMVERLMANDRPALRDYRRLAPFAVQNHPSEEHLLPLFVALGAGGDAGHIQRMHHSHEYGILAMDAYAFS